MTDEQAATIRRRKLHTGEKVGPFWDARAKLMKSRNPHFAEQEHIQPRRRPRFEYGMKKHNGPRLDGCHIVDQTMATMERMELYWAAHPSSPAAVRRPQLLMRGQLWIALLGPSVEEGIVGIGPTVEGALRAFDAQYVAGLRPPDRTVSSHA